MKLFLRKPTEKHPSHHLVNEHGEFITNEIGDAELSYHYQSGASGKCEVHIWGWYKERNCGSCKHGGYIPYSHRARYCWADVPEWIDKHRDALEDRRMMKEDDGTNCKCWEEGTHQSFDKKPWPVSPFDDEDDA